MPIHIDLNYVGTVIAIIGGILTIASMLGGAIHYIAIRPIKSVLSSLNKELTKLTHEIELSRTNRKELEVKLNRLEEKTSSAHHRLDDYKEELRSVQAWISSHR